EPAWSQPCCRRFAAEPKNAVFPRLGVPRRRRWFIRTIGFLNGGGGRLPTFRPRAAGDRTPVDIRIDARLVVAVFLGEADLRLQVLNEIFSIEEGGFTDA